MKTEVKEMKTKVKKNKSRLNAVTAFDVILVIIMCLFMATIILPFIHVIAVSFSSDAYVQANEVSFWPVGFNIDTYKQILLHDDRFITAYGNTIFYTVVGTAASLTCTAMAAYALARRKMVGQNLFSWMITITMFFSGGLIPAYMNISNLGLINNRMVMILPTLISTWNLIILRSFFIAYPQEIVESGQIDGLQEAGVFFRLVLPTSKAALATIGLYYAVAYWNSYMPARLYLRDADLMPVQHLLQKMLAQAGAQQNEETGVRLIEATVRYASMVITILPIMCVYPWLQKYFVKGVMVGSIKG